MSQSRHQKKTPVARGGYLDYPTQVVDKQVWTRVRVGGPEWFTWLQDARCFFYDGPDGGMTCRAEYKQRGRLYWIAYKTLGGRLYKRYIGKPEDVTLERLHEVWEKLRIADKQPASETKEVR